MLKKSSRHFFIHFLVGQKTQSTAIFILDDGNPNVSERFRHASVKRSRNDLRAPELFSDEAKLRLMDLKFLPMGSTLLKMVINSDSYGDLW